MQHQLEEVFAWLEAGDAADYQAGVLVLQQHCKNRSLVTGLLKKESSANREKLHYELSKCACGGRLEDLNEVLHHFAQAVQGAVPPIQQVADMLVEGHRPQLSEGFPEQPEPDQVPDELRPQLDDLTQLMSRVYNQRCQLSNSLATLSENDGPRVVGEILALEQQYNSLAQKRCNLMAGEQPTAPADEQPTPNAHALDTEESGAPGVDRAELINKRNSLRSNLSKARKKAENSKTEEKRSEYAQKAGRWEIELQQVEMQLKA